ncbi:MULTISPECIES: class I SAM-dependent methyltransferase [Halorubrum]|uniref:Methyltransferase domain n=1 Tax=Halorubrum sodomense TaxID=35743 RepID=A0A1I6H3L1_HALSD|nr:MULTISPECIES: class I SAM-dependent methyltransferase [Halorubrum]TKX54924.1 class I SAM-dependent methyltransferase [Halorubrum sp. SP3]TKX71558.1 class I SAM-dependent methyltransferase [Halorubrum sp. SP9]SFR49000.1 Methyltransferase domain [Halorubrum sodomense]
MTDHAAYLDAKRALDDRSLNRDVLDRFAAELPPEPEVLEVGAGTATMVERLVDWGVIEGGRWVAVDAHEEALAAGEARIGDAVGNVAVEFRAADAFEFAAEAAGAGRRFDAVVGCAFFDVVDAAPAVDALGEVTPVAYAPITYDGETRFAPPDPDDDAVLDRYHRHMREFRPGGPDGAAALAREATVIAEGPSPWRIEPPYESGERTVLAHLLDTVEEAVGETGYDASDWADGRREALGDGRLRYEAANRDLLVRLE